MVLAAFEPGIFLLLLWGLISWLTKKKKNKIGTDLGEGVAKPKEDLFARLQKLQEHLSQEVDIFPSSSPPMDTEEEYFAADNENGFDEPEILEPKSKGVHEAEGYAFETTITAPAKGSTNWLKQNISCKSELKKLMVFKEVLGEPRSLKPYTGDYFQS